MKLKINWKQYWDWEFNKKVLRMILPLILQSLIVAFINVLDTIFISIFSPEQLTGLGLTNDMFLLLIYSFWAISGAGGIYTTQYLGKKNYAKVAETTRIKLILALILAIIYFTLISTLRTSLINIILNLDNHLPKDNKNLISKSANDYLQIINYTTWFLGISLVFYNTMYECGDAWTSLYINFLPLTIKVILNLIFIKLFDWGVVGAAWSTFIARVCEFIVVIAFIVWKKPVYYPGWKIWKTTLDLWKKIMKNFVFIFMANALFALSSFVQKMIILKEGFLDHSYQAAILTFSIVGVFYSFFNGYYVAVPYFVGRELGANHIAKAKVNFYKILGFGLILNATIALLIIFSSPFILNFFIGNPAVIYVAKWYLAFQGIAFFFLSTSIIFFNILRIGGKNLLSSLIDILCTWVFIVGLTWFAFTIFKPNNYEVFSENWVMVTIIVFLIVSLAEIIQFSILIITVWKVNWANNLVKQ
ncbi:MATE family efflux transporter [Spiroplasma endosymbiont of Agriotes lineatus]|uniref:MATE family efflux transporter n=1 Tax=Spiroplasma endosymbiont of Agriotes lineatus TaxID=3077930 RepID=UPI0030D5DD4A